MVKAQEPGHLCIRQQVARVPLAARLGEDRYEDQHWPDDEMQPPRHRVRVPTRREVLEEVHVFSVQKVAGSGSANFRHESHTGTSPRIGCATVLRASLAHVRNHSQ